MAGDWIKMRTSLLTNPRVNGIARALESSCIAAQALTKGSVRVMSEVVTRDVMRHVTVSSLLVIWGAANEHTTNGVFRNTDLTDIDDMVGIPGFGAAMQAEGWLLFDEEETIVTLPNFEEYNTSGNARSIGAKTAATRQKEYRQRQKFLLEKGNSEDEKIVIDRDVTRDVTVTRHSNRREEKRREEEKHSSAHADLIPSGFARFWETWPATSRKTAKAECAKRWKARGLEAEADHILDHLVAMKTTRQWQEGYEPAPLTYLNQRRWEDGLPGINGHDDLDEHGVPL